MPQSCAQHATFNPLVSKIVYVSPIVSCTGARTYALHVDHLTAPPVEHPMLKFLRTVVKTIARVLSVVCAVCTVMSRHLAERTHDESPEPALIIAG